MMFRFFITELRPQNLKPTVKHGGGHGAAFRPKALDGIMNQQSYLKILKDNLKQSAEKNGYQRHF